MLMQARKNVPVVRITVRPSNSAPLSTPVQQCELHVEIFLKYGQKDVITTKTQQYMLSKSWKTIHHAIIMTKQFARETPMYRV